MAESYDVDAAAQALWNLHAQTRAWEELDRIEQDQMRHEARFVVDAALGRGEELTGD